MDPEAEVTDPIAAELKPIADAAARAAKFHKGKFFVALVGQDGVVHAATTFERHEELALAEMLNREPDEPADPPRLKVVK